jgi:hypothetical protein
VPVPAPEKKRRERTDCELTRRTVPRGNDPLSELFCSKVSNFPSFDIWSRAGSAEIDALAGIIWYECKCGHSSLVRAYEAGKRWARMALEGPSGLDEQIRRHLRIAKHCGYLYRFVVASEHVAAFFRNRHPDLITVVEPFEPCE